MKLLAQLVPFWIIATLGMALACSPTSSTKSTAVAAPASADAQAVQSVTSAPTTVTPATAIATGTAKVTAAAPATSVSTGTTGNSSSLPHPIQLPSVADQLFATVPHGAASLDALCANPGTDGLTSVTAMCATPRPMITSLADLRAVLKLSFTNNPGAGNGTGGNPAFVLTGQSASLVTKSVSSINPRAIVFTPNITVPNPPQPFNFLGFTRGDEFAEVATYDPVNNKVNMYVVFFQKACNLTNTCTAGDLLTPEVESNWVEISILEDDSVNDALGDTILDCQQCHQTQGPKVNAVLRMQENTAPFTHFFSSTTTGGKALLSDYFTAHGQTEAYGGIPGNLIAASDPNLLAQAVANAGFATQANAFPSATIEAEVTASSPGQPGNNSVSSVSATWTNLYQQYANGQFIPPAYRDVKVTDATKLQVLTSSYISVMNGSMPPSSLPDIRDVMKDDAQFQSDIGFTIQQGMSALGILKSACRQCHNSVLDQTRSRAKFNVDTIDSMSQTEKTLAVTRINQPSNGLLLMPPANFRSLSAADKATLNQLLSAPGSGTTP